MAFHQISKPGLFNKQPLVNTIKVSWAAKSAGPAIVVSSDIVAKLGRPVCARMLFGTGEHSGMMLLRPVHAKQGDAYTFTHPPRGKNGSSKIAAPAQHVKNFGFERGMPPTIIPHSFTDDGLVLDFNGVAKEAQQEAA